MFYVTYTLNELRRRSGRTILTALGLAIGVGLVVTVSALSTGLDRAQAKVLEPLTGVGTDLSVTRPLNISADAGPRGLSDKERKLLEQENGGARIGFQNLKPGQKFSRDTFGTFSQLSFPASYVKKIAALSGVQSVTGGLTLTASHISGTVPEETPTQRPQGAPGAGGGGGFNGPRSIDLTSFTVTGIDATHPALGAITPGQVQSGRYFSTSGNRYEAVVNLSYAARQNLELGDTIATGGKKFTIVGIAKTPLGGTASDVYVKLGVLQKLSGREGRLNTMYVRANKADQVAALARHIKASFDGASVTTAKDLADRISGSLVDAKNLTSKLGTALAVVGLAAAFLIASLLTLASVTKRIRELGTLKALGWPQRLVVRQVTGEALVQGLLGGVLGIAVGLGGAALVSAFAPTLKATVAAAADAAPRFGPFGQGAVTATGSTNVQLTAPTSVGLMALAVALALLGGLVAGAVGGLRASRLRPADALRHLD
jgi:ABC-type antimicrobial peptide transport system permease subunit